MAVSVPATVLPDETSPRLTVRRADCDPAVRPSVLALMDRPIPSSPRLCSAGLGSTGTWIVPVPVIDLLEPALASLSFFPEPPREPGVGRTVPARRPAAITRLASAEGVELAPTAVSAMTDAPESFRIQDAHQQNVGYRFQGDLHCGKSRQL